MDDVITPDQIVPLLLQAAPSFAEPWQAAEADGVDELSGARMHYTDAGAFCDHLMTLIGEERFDEVPAIFAVIEALHTDGDDAVRELATVGYLEGIQNAALNAGVDPKAFEPFLGPESLRWWRGLNHFWSGKQGTVSPVD